MHITTGSPGAFPRAKRFNEGKLPWHMLPKEALEGVVRVFEFGADRHGKWNWTLGWPYSVPLDSCDRHLAAFALGEDLDPDSGLHHLDHAITNLLMLRWHILRAKGEDDRLEGSK